MTNILRWALFVFLGALLSFSVQAQEKNEKQEQSGPWLRIYQKHVQGIYVNAADYRHGAPIKLDTVVIALSDEPLWPQLVPKTSLVNFVSGKAESGSGCIFGVGRGGVDDSPPMELDSNIKEAGIDQDVCGRFRLRVAKQLMSKAKACASYDEHLLYDMNWNLRMSPEGLHRLFVSNDLQQVRCLAQIDPIWVGPEDQSGMAVRNEVDIGREEERAYLNLDTNRAFGCQDFGLPVSYWHKSLPDAEAIELNYSFFSVPPTWEKHFFIKTNGFISSCWGGARVIDEPARRGSSLYLNDGTVLLKGESSVLRIRASDGSTEAPASLVKTFSHSYVTEVLNQHAGDMCVGEALIAGMCAMAKEAGYRDNGKNDEENWREYARHVVQGIDIVMQQIFRDARQSNN